MPFDYPGFVLSSLGIAGFVTGSTSLGLNLMPFPYVLATLLGGGGLLVAYVIYSRRLANPILDLSLFAIPSFRASVIGGLLFRIGIGAMPFLLPLMLQVGFGLSAVTAGNMVLATALGALGMKAVAPRILRRFGFRSSLVVNGVCSACGYAICGFFTPEWPHWLIFVILFMSGFSMSFQFTAYNTVAYDKVDEKRMSSANSFYSTFQQLMLSMGVCTAALTLHASMTVSGHSVPKPSDFSVAFFVVTAISLTATFWNLRFSKTAGEQMRGK